MPKFQYIDTTGATQSVDAVDAATAIKGAKNIAPNSGVSIQSAPSPVNMPAAPAMPAGTAPVPAAPKSKAFTGVLQPDGTFKYPGQDTGSAGAQPPKSDAANPTPPATTAAPAPSPTTLTMPEGQTLEQVAAANGTNVQAIMAANPQYANPTAVKTGSQLTLPGQKTLPSGNTPYGDVSKSIYGAVSAVPNQNDLGAVTSAGAAALTSAPPTTDLITASIQPIVDQMNALIAATVAPGPTYKSLSDEYQNLASSSGLNSLNLQLMNLGNVMNGTDDDIRSEVTASGGFATDSQVAALAGARNNVLLKQYNTLQAQQKVAQDYVTNTMQYESADQTERDNQQSITLNKITTATGILDKISNLQSTIVSNAQSQYNQIAFGTNGVGLTGLAQIVAGNPYQAQLAEMSLGLPAGTLSDPAKIAALQGQQDRKASETAAKAYFSANGVWPSWAPNGIPIGDPAAGGADTSGGDFDTTTGGTVVGGIDFGAANGVGAYASDVNGEVTGVSRAYATLSAGTDISTYIQNNAPNSPVTASMINSAAAANGIDPNILAAVLANESNFGTAGAGAKTMNPGNVGNTDNGSTKTMSSWQAGVDAAAKQLARRKATDGGTDPDTAALNSQVQGYVDAYKAGAITSLSTVPKGIRSQVAEAIAGNGGGDGTADGTDTTSYSPLAVNRFTRAANAIVANFIALPQYQLTANGLPYLQRIAAAEQNPGSVSDQDLLDSLTKLNSSGNAISDAQVKIITDGQSYSDLASVLGNKLKNGGVLSKDQRSQIQKIATAVYDNYKQGYQPVYDQASTQLKASGIPEQFWTIPDLNKLNGAQTGGGNNASATVDKVLTDMGYSYAEALAKVDKGNVGIIRGGQFGQVPASEVLATDIRI